jgi:cation diffusion facilitator family transporter
MLGNNYKKIVRVLWIILIANLGVAALKITIGSIIQSTSMTADGFHSLTDGSSNIIGLIGISLASKPVDQEHPYGHKKFETLAGLFIAGMLFFIGVKVILDALIRFSNPVVPQITLDSIIALIVTLIINIFVCKYEQNQGKKLNSYILISDSMHTQSDIYVSVGVLFTLICIKLGLPPIIDPIASLIVAGFVIHASFEVFKSTSGILVDKAPIDTEKIKEITMEFNQVKNVHKIRSRGSENDLHIDMHIMTEPCMSVEESHFLIHALEKRMRNQINDNVEIIVHLEPFYDNNSPNL